MVGVLIERKDLKQDEVYSLRGLPKIILIMKRKVKEGLHTQGFIRFPKWISNHFRDGGGGGRALNR